MASNFHNARSDYCGCVRARRESLAIVHQRENEAARFITLNDIFRRVR